METNNFRSANASIENAEMDMDFAAVQYRPQRLWNSKRNRDSDNPSERTQGNEYDFSLLSERAVPDRSTGHIEAGSVIHSPPSGISKDFSDIYKSLSAREIDTVHALYSMRIVKVQEHRSLLIRRHVEAATRRGRDPFSAEEIHMFFAASPRAFQEQVACALHIKQGLEVEAIEGSVTISIDTSLLSRSRRVAWFHSSVADYGHLIH